MLQQSGEKSWPKNQVFLPKLILLSISFVQFCEVYRVTKLWRFARAQRLSPDQPLGSTRQYVPRNVQQLWSGAGILPHLRRDRQNALASSSDRSGVSAMRGRSGGHNRAVRGEVTHRCPDELGPGRAALQSRRCRALSGNEFEGTVVENILTLQK